MELRPGEKPEFPMEGPFGGILDADFPSSQKERYRGFSSSSNILFREAQAVVRPSFTTLPPAPNGHAIVGAFDFYNVNGLRQNAIATRDVCYRWDVGTQAWIALAGALTGVDGNFFASTTVAQKLCFCQGVDKIQAWDGVGGAIAAVSVNAPVANYLMELDNHLLALNTSEAGPKNQRVHWSGIGDPTDWVSFASGSQDLFNDQGPINGGIKIFQLGYIFQQWGIVQVQPTGIGTVPFAFIPILPSKGKGLFCPYSLAGFKTQLAPYVGKDNVYIFNGVDSEPIGDHPIEGSRRIGARTQILADIKSTNPNAVWGQTTTAINGHDFNAYFLVIPSSQVFWVYNFDEKNWTRFTFSTIPFTSVIMSDFQQSLPIRISDLIGLIQSQLWSPNSLAAVNSFDSLFMGFSTGAAINFDFTGTSESPWSLSGPQWIFGDGRHTKTLQGLRLICTDNGATTISVSTTNEFGQSETHQVSFGTGAGKQVIQVIPFDINGALLEVVISGAAGQPLSISEIAPIYDTGEELPATTVTT